MGAAAELMSTPPRQLGQQGPAADPRVKPHLRLAAAREDAVAGMRQTGACLATLVSTLGTCCCTRLGT